MEPMSLCEPIFIDWYKALMQEMWQAYIIHSNCLGSRNIYANNIIVWFTHFSILYHLHFKFEDFDTKYCKRQIIH